MELLIKKLLLVTTAFATGFIAYFTVIQGIPITTLLIPITSRLEPVTSFLTNNKYTSLIGAGGITLIGILVKQFQNMKAKATTAFQEAQAWKSETFQINAVTDKLLQEKRDLETKVQTLQEQVTNIPHEKITELTTKIAELEKENQELRTESELWNKVKTQAT